MKIVHLCLGNYFAEGFFYQENLLAREHVEMGYEVSVIASTQSFDSTGKVIYDEKIGTYTNSDKILVTRIPYKRNDSIHHKLKWYSGVLQVLKRENPDILFIHNCQFISIGEVTKYLRSVPQIPVYVDNHADFSNGATNWFSKNILHKIVWRWCAHKIEPYAKKFYGVLPARVDFLKDVYELPAEKCELLVMGADDELVEKAKVSGAREQIRAQYGIAEDDFLVMTGGKINHNRPETLNLMRAVIELQRQNVKLLVFGTVADEFKQEFGGLCADGHIICAGWLKSAETYDYFVAADLVVFPGLHSVMWEQAVAQGKACVFRDIEGFHHVDIGGNAEFVQDVSTSGLKKVLIAILDDPQKYKTMRDVAEQKGMLVFSYKDIARRSMQ